MITLEQFKLIFKHIDDLDKNNDKLTELLVCKDTYGWISYADDLVSDIFNLLKSVFSLPTDDDIFEWYLYDISDGHKFIYEDTKDNKQIKFDLNDLDNLYYYIIGNFEKIPQVIVEKDIVLSTSVKSGEETLEYIKKQIVGEE